MSRQVIQIGEHLIGDEHPPFIIAEAGVHHYNSLELAKAYILNARLAGAQAIKFQTYKADRIAARWAPTYWDDSSGRTQYEIFASRSQLTLDDYHVLVEYAREVNINFLSTPFDPDSAQLLYDLGVPAFKIASADITNLPLLRVVAAFNLPVILSTGASTIDEIRQAVNDVQSQGALVAILHCTLAYPTPLKDANLRRITALREKFPDLVVGYSDHTQPQDSPLTCPLSVALGARVIEKHYTLNKQLPEDDHYHAVDQQGLIELVKGCANAFTMTTGYTEIGESEMAARTYARRSIVAARPLSAGTRLTMDDVDCKRPGTGLSPHKIDDVVGRVLKRSLDADELIQYNDLQ